VGSNQIQAGVEAVDLDERFWGVDLSAQDEEKQQEMNALLQLLKSSAAKRGS
jgi:methionine synthase II (cobalamin-independent)